MISRAILLALSRQRWLRNWAERSGATRAAVRRFVAGSKLADAVAVARKLEAEGALATLDHLGENVTSMTQAESSLAEALAAVKAIRNEGLRATVSIKLSQFGLDLDETACRTLVSTLVSAAREADSRVEIDMESTVYTDRTLEIVRGLHAEYGNVRAVVQAYLFRSEKDIEDLNRNGISVRLCKGAYLEGPDVAFAEKADVDRNYRALMARLLDSGVAPAIATHDETIVQEAIAHAARNHLGPEWFEFQMLYGIRRDLQRDLTRRGFRVRLYVPYGAAWYPYFMRRLAERPANVWFLLKNLGRR